jgi:elongation factor G
MKAFHFEGDSGEVIKTIEIPADILDRCTELREELVEKVASQDDDLMDKYFENGTLEIADIKKGLRKAVSNNLLYAVVC